MGRWHRTRAARVVASGGIIAYPTEGVFGLGCNPLDGRSVARIARLKGRRPTSGYIIIACNINQLRPFLDIDASAGAQLAASWPAALTWVVAARPGVPAWLTGGRETLAVRVPAHAGLRDLCAQTGPLVSTSANLTGRSPARDGTGVRRRFGGGVDLILPGHCGRGSRPSEIRELASGRVLRPA